MSKFSYMNWDRHLTLTPGIFQVPIMVLFTKHDQFERDIRIKLTSELTGITKAHNFDGEMMKVFEKHYTASLREGTTHIRLKSEEFVTD